MLDRGPLVYGATSAPQACVNATLDVVDDIFSSMGEVVMFGNLLPLAAGMFWGAPLISREPEQGTYRLAFTQSVTRHRWLAAKLGVLAGAAALLGGITGAVVTWTRTGFAPMFDTRPFGDDLAFTQAGAVPGAAWVFALLCGVTLGLLLRQTTTAIAVTLFVLPLAPRHRCRHGLGSVDQQRPAGLAAPGVVCGPGRS